MYATAIRRLSTALAATIALAALALSLASVAYPVAAHAEAIQQGAPVTCSGGFEPGAIIVVTDTKVITYRNGNHRRITTTTNWVCGSDGHWSPQAAAEIWSTNRAIRDAERALTLQAEVSYQRMATDQQAGRPSRKVGASATPERA